MSAVSVAAKVIGRIVVLREGQGIEGVPADLLLLDAPGRLNVESEDANHVVTVTIKNDATVPPLVVRVEVDRVQAAEVEVETKEGKTMWKFRRKDKGKGRKKEKRDSRSREKSEVSHYVYV